MRIPRIFHDGSLNPGDTVELQRQASQHICKVLRLDNGAHLLLFDGKGKSVNATLESCAGKQAKVALLNEIKETTESRLRIHLGLGISKGDRMDFAIQKAVEAGVTSITPLITDRTVVRLDDKRSGKKLAHWQGVIVSACEQSGRSLLPTLGSVNTLDSWLDHKSPCKIVFDKDATQSLSQLTKSTEVSILIGPEGGLSENEVKRAVSKEFYSIKLGPRILRTETAVVSAISALQTLWGDFA